jgi:F-type H+-transporting ATPase subunit gamma
MEDLEKLHKQLDSLGDLRSIVKTMKALSAASIRQYEQAVTALTGYYQTIMRGLYVTLKDSGLPGEFEQRSREPRRLAAIVFGSDHGLCGRFNELITGHALERMDSTAVRPENRLLLAVGARVAASLESQGQPIEENFLVPGSASQITATVQQILLKVDEWREQTGVYYVYLFYNRHTGDSNYQPTGIELLPLSLNQFHRLQEESWPSNNLPTFSMDRGTLLRRLLHQYLFVSIFRACAESQASEHSSRLASMQRAERNLDNRLEEVTTEFRRARQSAITAELLDVVSGFEAITAGEL